MLRILPLGLLTVWLAIAAAPTSAETVTITVATRDLDLATLEDVRRLHHRVAKAARQACRTDDDSYPFMLPKRIRCEHDAVAGAQRQVRYAILKARFPGEAAGVRLASR
jgi:UrcA family protein